MCKSVVMAGLCWKMWVFC